MSIKFNGYGEGVLTFTCASGVTAGSLVKMTDNGKVAVCSAGDKFIGVCLSVRGDIAAVQVGGYTELPFTGSGIAVGYCTLAADADGAVKSAQTGREYLVIEVGASAVGFILK